MSLLASPVRLATCPGKNNRPTVVVTKDWSIYMGNERAEDMTVDPFPLFGFGLGDFEEKVCEGWGFHQNLTMFSPSTCHKLPFVTYI